MAMDGAAAVSAEGAGDLEGAEQADHGNDAKKIDSGHRSRKDQRSDPEGRTVMPAVLRLYACMVFLFFGQAETENQLAHDIYKELIEINTTASAGNTTVAAEAMAARLKAAGFPESDIQILGPAPRKRNLV